MASFMMAAGEWQLQWSQGLRFGDGSREAGGISRGWKCERIGGVEGTNDSKIWQWCRIYTHKWMLSIPALKFNFTTAPKERRSELPLPWNHHHMVDRPQF